MDAMLTDPRLLSFPAHISTAIAVQKIYKLIPTETLSPVLSVSHTRSRLVRTWSEIGFINFVSTYNKT